MTDPITSTLEGTSVIREPRIAISIAETARLLSKSRSTVYEMANAGAIPTVRVGGSLMVPVVPLCKMFKVDPALFGLTRAELGATSTDAA